MSAQSERIDSIVSLTRADRETVKATMDNRRFFVESREFYVLTDVERDEIASNLKGRFRWLGQVGLHVYERIN